MVLDLLDAGVFAPNQIYKRIIQRGHYISRQSIYNFLKEFVQAGAAEKFTYSVEIERTGYKPLPKGRKSNLDIVKHSNGGYRK